MFNGPLGGGLSAYYLGTGFWALFVGVMQVVVSFEIRRLPEAVNQEHD
jgi:hypothetical protein